MGMNFTYQDFPKFRVRKVSYLAITSAWLTNNILKDLRIGRHNIELI